MSGGEYEYAFHGVNQMAANLREKGCCDCAPPELRKAFAEHLYLVGEAMKACEWNDSCDGYRDSEEALIRRVLGLPPAPEKEAWVDHA